MNISGNFSRGLSVLGCALLLAIIPIGCDQPSGSGVITPKTLEPPPSKSDIDALDKQDFGVTPKEWDPPDEKGK